MKTCEKLIACESEYFVHSPSAVAKEMYFYPLYTGHFIYEKGYSLYRDSYDSFLIMYIKKGSLKLVLEDREEEVSEGQFALIDCYNSHGYYSDKGCETLWCHFDGLTASRYYQVAVSHLGNVFYLKEPYPVINKLMAIYNTFSQGSNIQEALFSKHITDILTFLILYNPEYVKAYNHKGMVEEAMTYINEHFTRDITIDELAEHVNLSRFYFIRIFKKETGMTPHEHIVNTRINTAKYMLMNSELSVKDICFNTGFSCESGFCSSFKKNTGVTPTQYRNAAGSQGATKGNSLQKIKKD